MTEQVKDNRKFRKWYVEKADDLNEERRKQYATDPEAAEKARQAAAEYRQRRAEGERVEQVRMRRVHGEMIPVFTTGYVADRVGTTAQSIINWTKRGWIPAPIFDEKHRLYTKHQISQIRRIARSSRVSQHKKFQAMIKDIHNNWRN